MSEPRPPWREPMVWLIVAIPAASVIAGVGLVIVSALSGGADRVAEPVRRTGQIQVADLGPDALARQRRLGAVLRVDSGRVEVLPVSGEFSRAAPLHLALRHPTLAAEDRTWVLQPNETGWASTTTLDLAHDWKIDLQPSDGAWRLHGRLPKGQQAAYLGPALEGR